MNFDWGGAGWGGGGVRQQVPGPRTPPTVTFGERGNEFYFKFKLGENILTRVQHECSIFLFLPAPFVN